MIFNIVFKEEQAHGSAVPGAHGSHSVALPWATAFLRLSELSGTDSRPGWLLLPVATHPHPGGFSQQVLEKVVPPGPPSLPPGTRVFYAWRDVRAGWRTSVLPGFL